MIIITNAYASIYIESMLYELLDRWKDGYVYLYVYICVCIMLSLVVICIHLYVH